MKSVIRSKTFDQKVFSAKAVRIQLALVQLLGQAESLEYNLSFKKRAFCFCHSNLFVYFPTP